MEQYLNIIIEFFKSNIANIIWIVVLYIFGRSILQIIVHRLMKLADDKDDENESMREKRAKTLGKVIITIGNVVIFSIILLMALSVFGVDIRPILAGVGIVGLAIGFGAQTLVKDFVSGLFILIENQYNIGDEVKIGTSQGEVEKITLRSTVLRDKEGQVYYMSNGKIDNVINLSRK